MSTCTAPEQRRPLPAGVDLARETVITGRVVDDAGEAVGGAFVRLLDSSQEFTAEVVASPPPISELAVPSATSLGWIAPELPSPVGLPWPATPQQILHFFGARS